MKLAEVSDHNCNNFSHETITVLTLHVKERKKTIVKCVESVFNQDFKGNLCHKIIVDGSQSSMDKLLQTLVKLYKVEVQYFPDISKSLTPRIRMALLRRAALEDVSSKWLAWLDDDNWWETNHLSTLLEKATQNSDCLSYSYRRLWTKDNQPYQRYDNPWQSEETESLLHTQYLEKLGIRTKSSHLVRDALFPEPLGAYYGTIDMGEWFFPTCLAKKLGIPLPKSKSLLGADDLLLAQIVQDGYKVQPTGAFTLNYRIGGSSSN